MKPHSRKRYTLLASVLLVVGSVVVASFLWVRVERRKYAMNRELIDSLAQGNFKQSLHLVESGADANTRVIPLSAPTFWTLLQQLLHPSTLSANNSPTAFMVVCGDCEPVWSDSVKERKVIFPRDRLHDPELLPLAQVMLLHGANINSRDEIDTTMLMWASCWGLTDRMALLLKNGALTDLHDTFGNTALHYATTAEQHESVKLLLKYHANPNMKSFDGRTPLSIALQRKDSPEIIHLLKQAGAKE